MAQALLCIAALYRFTPFADPASLRGPLLDACLSHNIKGTLLLAREGINGTIAGTPEAIDTILAIFVPCPVATRWNGSFPITIRCLSTA